MAEKEAAQLKYARCIGKQIQNLQQIFCPRCLEQESVEEKRFYQNLCAVGDFEEELFCPHCELRIKVIVYA